VGAERRRRPDRGGVRCARGRGETIDEGDLTISAVAVDAGVRGLVPAASLGSLVGLTATIDVAPGTLLVAGMWDDGRGVAAGERAVGAVLRPGRAPGELDPGSSAVAVAVDDEAISHPVRVLEASRLDGGELRVTLAVDAAAAAAVARLAATDRLVLVGEP